MAHGWRAQSIKVRKAWQQEGGSWPTPVTSKKTVNAGAQLTLYSIQDQFHGTVLPT